MKKVKYFLYGFIPVVLLFMGFMFTAPAEGMYPLSEIHKLDLKKEGLKIDVSDIYNPDGIGLIDGLVNIGGCTGSFVSDNGLIITNHHCAFRAINEASSTENNYLEEGYLAETAGDEIPAKGYTVKITESYEDVSDKILEGLDDIDDLAERGRIIDKRMREMGDEATDMENSVEAEVSEMFVGKTYLLFKYRIIEDVRLVYAPPRSIGEFGGELDNWEWPRHTGDFTFMRAYVAPDGSSAPYSEDNVPFKPVKHLQVNPEGVEEGDFVFILGYPGRTFRHKPSEFIEYQLYYQMPYIQELYSWMIDMYEGMIDDNPDNELRYATDIKRLANVEKNYRGKILGLNKINLVEKKKEQEEEMQEFIENNPEMKKRYGDLFAEIDAVYEKIFSFELGSLWFNQLLRRSDIIYSAHMAVMYAQEIKKPNDERDYHFRDNSLDARRKRFVSRLSNYDPEFERMFIAKMFRDALEFEEGSRIKAIEQLVGDENPDEVINDYAEFLVSYASTLDPDSLATVLEENPDEILEKENKLFDLMEQLEAQYREFNELDNEVAGRLNKLSPQLIAVKKAWKEQEFVPDANGTLRLTYGHIKGYSPADAVSYSPITTLEGVIEKSYSGGVYEIPDKIYELYENQDYGRFYDEEVGGLPTGILYDMDTSGGNSGSPILDAYGRLIGVNFDRSFGATINDFAWDESYSRSIGVDIRYVLWITQKVGGADYLLEEMGVSTN